MLTIGLRMPILRGMEEFFEYVRRRKAKLRQELVELEAAERIYRQSLSEAASEPKALEKKPLLRPGEPRTVKERVIRLLEEAYPGGLGAAEILARIQERWRPDLQRWSLSPQLTRLKKDEYIYNDKGRWKLIKEDAPPAEAKEAPQETEAPAATGAQEVPGGRG